MQRYYHSRSISQCRLLSCRGEYEASACPSLYRVREGEAECPRLGDCPLYMRAETSVYTQGNFRIYENKFLHIRKNISAYAKFYRRAHRDLSPHIQRLLCGYDCTFFACLFPVRKTIPLKRSEEPPGGCAIRESLALTCTRPSS